MRAFAAATCSLFVAVGSASAQVGTPPTEIRIVAEDCSRIVDPKLPGGAGQFRFRLEPAGASVQATATVLLDGAPVDTLWSGTLLGGAAATLATWDGRDGGGARCATGHYALRVAGIGATPLVLPVDVVRLGITEIEAQDSPAGDDEHPMVYFMKGSGYDYYATPQIHEYVNVARAGEVSDLDQDDGEPRPVVPVHEGTESPALDGADYATAAYNYPVSYVMGAHPRLELTFGAQGTTALGASMGAGYPVPGYDVRARITGLGDAATGPLAPGVPALVDLDALPAELLRVDLSLSVRYEYRAQGATDWLPIPGAQTLPWRVYTLLGPPVWTAGASGTRYKGPWVEVAEYVSSWGRTLGWPVTDDATLTEVFVHGFFGQNGGIATPIEDVVYDAYPLGGDGGATHYFNFGGWRMDLSHLLNDTAYGRYVNCSDNMGCTTTMLSMLGATDVRPLRLGSMQLRAIWGIGAPGYTTKLWGSSHGFSYHHIVTHDDGDTVSDTCMQLDEDGDPDHVPGVPGWNDMRRWDGPNGYNALSSNNNVNRTVESLPGIQ